MGDDVARPRSTILNDSTELIVGDVTRASELQLCDDMSHSSHGVSKRNIDYMLCHDDAVFGATNARFTGGYAEYAVASATTLAKMPQRMGFIEAASVPVVACTAWQIVVEYGVVDATKRVLVHGAAGNVGAYAVQLARRIAHEVVATAFSDDVAYVQTLGVDGVIDVQKSRFEDQHLSNPAPDRRAAALRSCWPKPLGADRVARLSRLHQQGRRRLHESVGTADEAVNHSTKAFQQRLDGW
jgi:threonine dehydrogenase-like Zn-dependent dehydrogenase